MVCEQHITVLQPMEQILIGFVIFFVLSPSIIILAWYQMIQIHKISPCGTDSPSVHFTNPLALLNN